MSFRCGHCKSRDTQEGVHETFCLECGGLTATNGQPVSVEEQFTSKEN